MIRINRFNCSRAPLCLATNQRQARIKKVVWFFDVHTGLSGVNCRDQAFNIVRKSIEYVPAPHIRARIADDAASTPLADPPDCIC